MTVGCELMAISFENIFLFRGAISCRYISVHYLPWIGPVGTGDLSFHVYEAEFVCTKCCCGLLLANEYMIQVRNLGSSDLEIVGVVEVAFFPSWCWWLISMEL